MSKYASGFSTAKTQDNRVPRLLQLAGRLEANGYRELLAIKPGTKKPDTYDWTTPRDWRTLPAFKRRVYYTGVLTRLTPVVDIDIRNPVLAKKLIEIADRIFGPAPIRIGQPPKAGLIYRLADGAEPFPPRQSDWFAFKGEDLEAPDLALTGSKSSPTASKPSSTRFTRVRESRTPGRAANPLSRSATTCRRSMRPPPTATSGRSRPSW